MEIIDRLLGLFRIREKKEEAKKWNKCALKVHYRKGYELYERTS